MEGMDALFAAAAASSNGNSDDDEMVPLDDNNAKPKSVDCEDNVLPSSQNTTNSTTEVVSNWTKPKKPTVHRPVKPLKPKGKKVFDFKAAWEATKIACIENGKLLEKMHDSLIEKCAVGKKQEEILAKAQRTAAKARKWEREAHQATEALATEKRMSALKKNQFRTELAMATSNEKASKEESSKLEKSLEEEKKEHKKTKKELDNEKCKLSTLQELYNKAEWRKSELMEENRKMKENVAELEKTILGYHKQETRLAITAKQREETRKKKKAKANAK